MKNPAPRYRTFVQACARLKVGAPRVEDRLLRTIAHAFLRLGDLAIDGGANLGQHACAMARRVGPVGLVYAFEPDPRMHAHLEMRCAEELVPALRTVRAALSDVSGEAEFLRPPGAFSHGRLETVSSALDDLFAGGVERCSVSSRALDDMHFDRPVRFIKLDIEGAEPLALAGAAKLLKRDEPILAFEALRHNAPSSDPLIDCAAVLTEAGYRIFTICGDSLSTPYPCDVGLNFIALPRSSLEATSKRLCRVVSGFRI